MSGNAQKPQSGTAAAEGSWSVGATGSGKFRFSDLLPTIGDVVGVRDPQGRWVDIPRGKPEPIYLDPWWQELGDLNPSHGLSISGDRGGGYGPSGDECYGPSGDES